MIEAYVDCLDIFIFKTRGFGYFQFDFSIVWLVLVSSLNSDSYHISSTLCGKSCCVLFDCLLFQNDLQEFLTPRNRMV